MKINCAIVLITITLATQLINSLTIPEQCASIKAAGIVYATEKLASSVSTSTTIKNDGDVIALQTKTISEAEALHNTETSESEAQIIANGGTILVSTGAQKIQALIVASALKATQLSVANAKLAAETIAAAELKAAQAITAAELKAAEAITAAAMKAKQIAAAAARAAYIHTGMTPAENDAEYLSAANQEASELGIAADLYGVQTILAANILSTQTKDASTLLGLHLVSASSLKGQQLVLAANLLAGL